MRSLGWHRRLARSEVGGRRERTKHWLILPTSLGKDRSNLGRDVLGRLLIHSMRGDAIESYDYGSVATLGHRRFAYRRTIFPGLPIQGGRVCRRTGRGNRPQPRRQISPPPPPAGGDPRVPDPLGMGHVYLQSGNYIAERAPSSFHHFSIHL